MVERSYERSYTTEGFPLPTIKEWNNLIGQIEKMVTENAGNSEPAILRGSVEELDGSNCSHCGDELIRQFMGETPAFNVGVIYCAPGVFDKNHPGEYWAEIWPNANYGKDRFALPNDEFVRNYYRLSNPRVKKCFNGFDITWHRQVGLGGTKGDMGLTYFSNPTTTSLPEPRYVHK